MNKNQINKILSKAEKICAESGNRFTDKRKNILSILIQSSVPLSAYEVAGAYNQSAEANMPVMSVYRILDFLAEEDLAHKLSSTNKYVACSHIQCSHSHGVPQFLICSRCQKVKEITIQKDIINQLENEVDSAGFKLTDTHLELQCLCKSCVAA